MMHCPKCGMEMEEGIILCNCTGLPWFPRDKTPHNYRTNAGILKIGGVLLSPITSMHVYPLRRRAWICQACKLSVVDYKEGDTTVSAP